MIGGLWLLVLSMLRFMRGAPGSTLTVCAGITIGIVSITGVHLLGERIGASLDAERPAYLAGITHVLTEPSLDAGDLAELRARWRRGELPGVTALIPVHEHVTRGGLHVVGTDWLAALDAEEPAGKSGVSPFAGIRALDQSAMVGEPALISGLAHAAGTTFELNGVRLFVLANSAMGRSETGREDTPRVMVDIGTAFAISGEDPGYLDAVLLVRPSPHAVLADWLEALMPGISAGLPAADMPDVPGYQVHAVDAELPSEGLVRAVLFNLGALGTLSLLVALLLMYQTATLWLRRQQRILRSLHDVGVPRRMLMGSFIGALVLLAIPATALGILSGSWLAGVLQRIVLGNEGLESLVPGQAVIIKAVVAGAGIAVLGGAFAWWRSGDRTPLPGRHVRSFVILMVVLGLAGWWWPRSGLAGIFLCILLFSMLAAFAASPLLHALKARTSRLTGPLWMRLGLRETAWFPGDLVIACAALALAVAVSIGVGLMVDSFRREFTALLDARLSSDVMANLPASVDASVLAGEIRSRPEVGNVVLSGEVSTRVNGLPVVLGFASIDAVQAARYGYTGALRRGEVLINETLAGALRVKSGASISDGSREVRVAGVFKGYGEPGMRMVADTSLASEFTGRKLQFDRIGVTSTDPQATATWLRGMPGVEVSLGSAVRTRSLLIFDRTFATSDALTWLALIIASGALINALIGFRVNQQATGRLLDSIGAPSHFNLGASLVRAFVVAGVALVIAVPLGTWLGFVLCSEVNPRAFGWTIGFSPTPVPVLIPAVLALCAALLAGCGGGLMRLPGTGR